MKRGMICKLTERMLAARFETQISLMFRMTADAAGWTFGVIKSLQQVDLYIFVKIITDMVKKMLFLHNGTNARTADAVLTVVSAGIKSVL